ncbi:MAG: YciI-like protein [Telluria sp.]|nr:YciI-like protein [Telluria sp.]
MHYLLCYDLAADYLERRGEFRTEHLQLAWAAQERGDIIVAGALSDPADMAVLMFQGDSPDVAERFAKADPYVLNGLVTGYRVRQWNTVVGDSAATPVRA